MRARWIAAAVVALLAAPATAQAGGWATVSLSSTPDGVKPGQPWLVELDIRQHGVTPLDGVEPAVILTKAGTSTTRTFQAEPTGRPGMYLARAVFPTGGRWEYVVDDGFGQRHSYPPVTIGGTAPALPAAASSDDFPWLALGAALLAGLGVAALTWALQRRRRPQPLGSAT